jgi:hypothetical protein
MANIIRRLKSGLPTEIWTHYSGQRWPRVERTRNSVDDRFGSQAVLQNKFSLMSGSGRIADVREQAFGTGKVECSFSPGAVIQIGDLLEY